MKHQFQLKLSGIQKWLQLTVWRLQPRLEPINNRLQPTRPWFGSHVPWFCRREILVDQKYQIFCDPGLLPLWRVTIINHRTLTLRVTLSLPLVPFWVKQMMGNLEHSGHSIPDEDHEIAPNVRQLGCPPLAGSETNETSNSSTPTPKARILLKPRHHHQRWTVFCRGIEGLTASSFTGDSASSSLRTTPSVIGCAPA